MSTSPQSLHSDWSPELSLRARGISWLICDVDGVLTDGTLYLSKTEELFKGFSVKDGLGLQLARRAGLGVGILSLRSSDIVAARARELGIEEILQGCPDKKAAFEALLERRQILSSQVAYIGDDLPDLPILLCCGLAAAPPDAAEDVLHRVHYVTRARAGAGAVRELVERILRSRGVWQEVLDAFLEESRDA